MRNVYLVLLLKKRTIIVRDQIGQESLHEDNNSASEKSDTVKVPKGDFSITENSSPHSTKENGAIPKHSNAKNTASSIEKVEKIEAQAKPIESKITTKDKSPARNVQEKSKSLEKKSGENGSSPKDHQTKPFESEITTKDKSPARNILEKSKPLETNLEENRSSPMQTSNYKSTNSTIEKTPKDDIKSIDVKDNSSQQQNLTSKFKEPEPRTLKRNVTDPKQSSSPEINEPHTLNKTKDKQLSSNSIPESNDKK
ncbi:hypothetical protein CEXT_31211 [Caerostris extrusa]|uniref:Uncharacterized protein n=1 Tax=Caerostris extrusa TaxID=172846 RepID=A0AAV4XIP7_CAEEX|nr:hypothetical protein CEXT_31211 [Caerostris extrusa]